MLSKQFKYERYLFLNNLIDIKGKLKWNLLKGLHVNKGKIACKRNESFYA